jgi:integrase/recombinase XerD
MTDPTITVASLELVSPGPDEADLAAVGFLARYNGRTLDAYRQDLRGFFQWTGDHGVASLAATRAHIELYRMSMEQRGLAPSTIDRRLSTVCGYYRFAHIDGRIPANPAQYVRAPRSPRPRATGWTAPSSARSCSLPNATTRCTPPWPCCSASTGCGCPKRAVRTSKTSPSSAATGPLAIVGKGNKPAVIPLVPRTARTIDLAIGECHEGPILRRRDGQRLDRRTAHRWVRSIGRQPGLGVVHPHMLRAGFIMAALDAGGPVARRPDRRPSRRPPHHHVL